MISKFKLDLNLSCAKDFGNLNSMVTWCINWRRLLALIFFLAPYIKIISHYKKIGYNIYVLQQKACLVVNPITVGNFAFLFNCTPVGRTLDSMPGTLWLFRLKEMVGAWCFGCCQAHRDLPVGFLLLRYSVLFTVESLSLLYLLFICWFICSRRWCIDKLGSFMQTKHLYVLIHIWTKGEVGAPSKSNRF